MSENRSPYLVDLLLSLLTSGKVWSRARLQYESLDYSLRLIIINFLGLISSVVIFTVGTFEVHGGNLNLGLVMWVIGFLIFIHLFLLRTELPYEIGAILIMLLYGAFCSLQSFPQFYSAREHAIVEQWFFTFPSIAVFTLGSRISAPLVLVVLGVNLAGIANRNELFSPGGFFGISADIIRPLVIYLLLYLLMLAYEFIRNFKDRFIDDVNKKLRDERKNADELRKQAEQANRVKSEFLSRTTHELRTPLNAIIGMTSIAKTTADPERIAYCLNQISSAGAHLLGVINDVLDIAKIEADKFELSITEFELQKTLDRIVGIIEYNLKKKSQILELEFIDNLPAVIRGDEQRLAQVFANLLGNAQKFTPEKGKISFRAEKISELGDIAVLRFIVRDTGIGISPAQQAKLFNPFQQADGSTSRKFGGTGLGLAISKRIIEAMGGKIHIESELGKGAAFIFTVQVIVPTAGNAEHRVDSDISTDLSAVAESVKYDFQWRRILLVDDVEINREIAQTFLENTNLQVDEASDGQEAYNLFAAAPEKYDLILMDIQMPTVDGYEATSMIRQHPQGADIPIIAMTANVFKEDIERCRTAGMNHHLGKPIDIDALLRALKTYLAAKT